jgi:DNA polymerase V
MKSVSFIRTSPKELGEVVTEEGYKSPLSLDELLITHPTSTFFVRVGEDVGEAGEGVGVFSGDLLVVDRALKPSLGKLVLVAVEGDLVLRRYTEHEGRQYVVGGEGITLALDECDDVLFWGVVKNIIREV